MAPKFSRKKVFGGKKKKEQLKAKRLRKSGAPSTKKHNLTKDKNASPAKLKVSDTVVGSLGRSNNVHTLMHYCILSVF